LFFLLAGTPAMAALEKKERYRRRALLCYEIAVTLPGERASSAIRLGDAYAALAVQSDRSLPNVFLPAAKHPRCEKCGQNMRLAYSLPRTDSLPAMQAFRCDDCAETLIWKGELPSYRSGGKTPGTAAASEGDQWTKRYVAVSFRRAGKDLAPGPAIECPDASTVILRAELMTKENEIVGAVAFSRRSNPHSGEFEAAVILKTFGEIAEGFDIA
jgi:hypothetical protein